MSNYVKATNFTAKDSLPSGDSSKLIKGTEIDVELTAVSNAIATKSDSNSPTFTGTPAGPTASAGTNTTQLATTAYVIGERAATATLSNKTLASPIMTGTPTAPTASNDVNNTQVATTAYVKSVIAATPGAGAAGTVTSVDVGGGTTGLTTSGGPITSSGVITLGGTLAVSNGGTGGTTQATARTGLGLGTIATQNLDNVNITGGSITGTYSGMTAGTATTATTATSANSLSASALSSQFASSNATAGYQKLPTGITIQWGTVTGKTTGTASHTVNFPTAFDNNCLQVLVQWNAGAGDFAGGYVNVTSTSASSFTVQYTANIRWIAIGY